MIRFVSLVAVVAVLAAGVLALPVDVPYTVSTVGKVLPAAEWVLVRDQGGTIGTLLRDHLDGTVRSSDLHHFERGDAVHVELNPALRVRSSVGAGDTVLTIHSNETHRQLAALTGEIAAAQSAISLYASGEKDAVVEAAARKVARAVEQAEQQRRRVERLRALRERQLVAEQDLEDAVSLLQIYEAEVDIARAEHEAVSTGSKREQLSLAETQSEARQRELRWLAERVSMQTIVAPISGVAVRSFGTDTLLTVLDTSAAVVVMPVAWRDRSALQTDQKVRVELDHSEVTGRIIEIGRTIERVGREQVVMVTAQMERAPRDLVAGAMVRCHIETEQVRLLEYVRRKVL